MYRLVGASRKKVTLIALAEVELLTLAAALLAVLLHLVLYPTFFSSISLFPDQALYLLGLSAHCGGGAFGQRSGLHSLFGVGVAVLHCGGQSRNGIGGGLDETNLTVVAEPERLHPAGSVIVICDNSFYLFL